MLHSEWVESVRATGGVSNDHDDIDAAITGAANFIWALLDTRNIDRNCVFHGIRPLIPATSDQLFHDHPTGRR